MAYSNPELEAKIAKTLGKSIGNTQSIVSDKGGYRNVELENKISKAIQAGPKMVNTPNVKVNNAPVKISQPTNQINQIASEVGNRITSNASWVGGQINQNVVQPLTNTVKKIGKDITLTLKPKSVEPKQNIITPSPTVTPTPAKVETQKPVVLKPKQEALTKNQLTAVQRYTPIIEGKTTIGKAPVPNMWNRITQKVSELFDSSESQVARAMNAKQVQNLYKEKTGETLPITKLAEKGGNPLKNSLMEEITKELGIRQEGTTSEITGAIFNVGIAVGLVSATAPTLVSIGVFSAVNELKSGLISAVKGKGFKLGAEQNLSDLFEEAPADVKNVIDIVDFLLTAKATHKVYKASPKAFEMLTKDIITKVKGPQTINFTPEQVKKVAVGLGSKYESDFLAKAGLSKEIWKRATKEGISIEMPTEKIVHIMDKPYWAKIKQVFNKPLTNIKTEVMTEGSKRLGFAGYLPKGEYTPQEVVGVVLKNNLQDTPEGKEVLKVATEAQKNNQNIVVDKTETKAIDKNAELNINNKITQHTEDPKGIQVKIGKEVFYAPLSPEQSVALSPEIEKVITEGDESVHLSSIKKLQKEGNIETTLEDLIQKSPNVEKSLINSGIDTNTGSVDMGKVVKEQSVRMEETQKETEAMVNSEVQTINHEKKTDISKPEISKTKYERGNITKLQKEIEQILGIPENNKLPLLERQKLYTQNYDITDQAAEAGDEQAKKDVKRISELLEQIDEQRKLKNTPTKDLNKALNVENSQEISQMTVDGKRDEYRLDNAEQLKIAQKYEANGLPGDITPETKLTVYRAGTGGEIEAGDFVTLNESNAQKYLNQRKGSKVMTSEVTAKDLVFSGGLKSEFIYAPKTLDKPTEKPTITANEDTTLQSKRLPDTDKIPAEVDRGSNAEVDERTQHDTPTGASESGAGLERARTGKAGRLEANSEAEVVLMAHNYSTKASDYTKEELDKLRLYSGAGGKESAGATGKGLLSEYYTPPEITDMVWNLAKQLAPHAKTALEPSIGVGSLLEGRPKDIKFSAYEYQKVSGTIAKVLNQDIDVKIGTGEEFGNPGNFETHEAKPEYDLVIGNPPFGERASFLKGKGNIKNINRWEEYFIVKGLQSLKEGGHLIYVVNSSFLNKGSTAGKDDMKVMGSLVTAYRLPEGIFKDTTIGTDIVVFKKGPTKATPGSMLQVEEFKEREVDLVNGNYFIKHPENVAGTIETRNNRFGKPETFVRGTLADVKRITPVIEEVEPETVDIAPSEPKTVKVKPAKESQAAKTVRTVRKQAKEGKLPRVIVPDNTKVEVVAEQTLSGSVKALDPVQEKIVINTKVDGTVEYSEAAKQYLNYQGGEYFNDTNYFSGDIYQKIEDLKKDRNEIESKHGKAQYEKQLKGLQKILPKPMKITDIVFDPLDRYIGKVNVEGVDLVDAFSDFVRNNDLSLSYGVSKYDIRNYVLGYRAAKGTKQIMGKIKEDAVRLFNYYIREVLSDDIQTSIVDKFNREKNSYVTPDYSKLPVKIKGMAKYFRGKTFNLSRTQMNGVSFLTNKGVGLIAYGVGVGKTHTLLASTIVAKQRGWTKRPAFIVPKSTLSKTWIGTIKAMFPKETIVNLGGLTKPEIRELSKERGIDPKGWIKDGEIVTITHEGLLRLALTPDEMNSALKDLQDALSSQSEETDRKKEVEAQKITEILGKAQYKADDIKISDLGIDHISVDEVHNFRKIFQGAKPEALNDDGTVDKSKSRRFGNVIGGTPSKQAQQLFLISQHILKNNNNRGVYLASATPFENHATEVYNILSLIARDRLKKIGIYNINDFFALFSNFETELEKNMQGEWVNKEKMKSFKNLLQLQKILREFVDFKVDPTLVRPERRVLTPHLQMSALQEQNLELIQEMIKPSNGKQPEDGAILKASTYSVANSISPYFIREYVTNVPTPDELVENSPKIKYAMELIRSLLKDKKTNKYGTFLYLGANGVDYHGHLEQYATQNLGLKPEEVAVINGTTPADERESIKDNFNSGKVKLLIGGDPTKEGIDLQNNGFTTINLALGWNPTEVAQVEGRVWRQGNKRSIAPLVYPLVENSGDVTIYNKFEEKGGRINDMFSYQGQIFDVGELDPREKKLALMTRPEDKAAIEIELDKAELKNKLIMVETDIGYLEKLEIEIPNIKDSIKSKEERIASGKTSWGTTITPESLSEYRKEVAGLKNKLKSIEGKLERRNIKNIRATLESLENQKEEINIELGKINDTYAERLLKFTNEYDEMIAKRKSISDHVNEFTEVIKELKELTDEELAAQKLKLVADYEANQRRIDNLSSAKPPTGDADIGGYADIEPTGEVIDRIRAIEFPELTRMVREITGNVPKLKAFKNALGRAYYKEGGQVKLNPNIFNDPVIATKVLAHEIGHIASYMPEGITTRGNIVGHIASLNKFMERIYGELDNKVIRKELKALVQIWKPFDESANPKITAYMYSSKEMYADAVSVLLNNPELLKKIAPNFYEGFFDYIHSKPEFEETYFDTLTLLNQGEEAVNEKRLEEIYEGFKEAAKKRQDIENTVKPQKSWFEKFMRNHVTKFDPIYRKLDKVNIGVVESSTQKVREALEIMQMRRNDQALFLDRITTEITDALERIGMTEVDLGVVLKLEREALGDRVDLANPGGLIGNIPELLLGHFYKKRNLSPEQVKVFEQIKKRFHDLVFEETKRAVENGNFNKQVFEEKILPNKDTYATFSVVDYIHTNYISAGIKKQVGTLSRIENPFTSTILKTMALIDWNNMQEAKQVAIGELVQYFPDDVKEAQAIRSTDGQVIKFKVEDGKEILEIMRDGKRVGYNVDPYIKSMFENENVTPDELHSLVAASRVFNSIFKKLVTSWNLAWGFYTNIVRDQKRTYIHLGAALNKFAPGQKGLSVGELLATWVKSIPEGARFAAGQKTELIKEILANKAMNTTWAQYDTNANNDSDIAFLLRKHKVIGTEAPETTLRKIWNMSGGRLIQAIEYAGGTFEATSKISGYQIAKKRISDGKRLGFIVRNYVGTPNYVEGGAWKQVDNDVFVFSNVMIQATRAAVELGTDPKTRSGYWWRTFNVGILPKILMIMGMAGLFGKSVKDNFDRQSEYDKTNFITVPVGSDENGKAIYARLPQDETERFVSAIVWKVLSGMVKGKVVKPEQVLSVGAGYIPSTTPLWDIVGGWLGYMQGKPPYDNYRGRLAIDETAWKAGGMIRLNKMVQYTLNEAGLANFKTYDNSNKSTLEVTVQNIPIISRMFQVSDYGLQEEYSSNVDQEAAQKSIAKRDLVDKYVKQARGISDPVDLSKIRTDMIREYFGEMPKNKDQVTEAKALAKKFMIQREIGSSPYMDKLIFSNLNAEKVDYLKQFKKNMREDDFKKLMNDAIRFKVISKAVVDSIKAVDNK